jgi:uncharacterized protein
MAASDTDDSTRSSAVAGPWTWLLLVAALAGPPAFVVGSRWLFGEAPSVRDLVLLQFGYCLFAAAVLWLILRRERLSVGDIGIRRPNWSTLAGALVLALVALFVLPVLTAPLLRTLGTNEVETGLRRLALLPSWLRIVVALTGGAVEELFYRGYAVERLSVLTARRWLGGALAALAFALAHVGSWGITFSLIADLPFGIMMTAFYLWRRDLIANIAAHSGTLVVAMFIAVP